MKSIWNDDKDDFVGIVLKYILKWITLVCLAIVVIGSVVKLFQIYNF